MEERPSALEEEANPAPISSAVKGLLGPDKPKFGGDSGFYMEVKRRVQQYFEDSGRSKRDNLSMYLKTAVILLWFCASYTLLIFVVTSWWQGVLASLSLALAIAGIGFSIQHDANHGAYSRFRPLNRLLGMSLDFLGGSSYIWYWKHNISHHTYTNLNGTDNDIDLQPWGRLSPEQERKPIHRFQHYYMWGLYAFMHPHWQVEDLSQIVRARIARHKIPRPRGWDLAQLITGKLGLAVWAFLIPLLVHPWWVVLIGYIGIASTVGLVLGVTFQMAHCVEKADFPAPKELSAGWAEHQVQTTVNIGRGSRLLAWYIGGLNFQIEHHLFPRVCHIHYPRIAKIVQEVCVEFDLRYRAHSSLFSAIASHGRWLRQMGRPLAEA